MSRRSFDQRSSQFRSSLVTTVPVRRRRFSASPLSPVTLRHRLLQRDLHFRDGRDRRHQRHGIVENMILPQIGVGEHVIADHLRLSQARAMADHQPAMRTQHRDMIGDVLRVRGPDADIHETHALPVRADDVIGRHLEAVPGDGEHARFRLLRRKRAIDDGVAGQHHLRDALVGVELLQSPLHELVDIAVVVRQQHPGLHRAPVGARVMHEPSQRIIDARRVERAQAAARRRGRIPRRPSRRRWSRATAPGNSAQGPPRRRRRSSVRRRSRRHRDRRISCPPTPTSIAAPYSETSGSSCSSR